MYTYFVAALVAATVLSSSSSDYNYQNKGDDWQTIMNGKYALCGTGL